MKKILIFSLEFPPMVGGAGTYSYELAKGLVNTGNKVTILTLNSNQFKKVEVNKVDNELNALGIKIIRKLWINKIWFVYWPFLLKRFLRVNKFDLLVVANEGGHIVASHLNKNILKNYIVVFHGKEDIKFFGSRSLHSLIQFSKSRMHSYCENSSKIISVSEYLKNQFDKCGFSPEKVKIVHNGIDISFFKPMSENENQKVRSAFLIKNNYKGSPKIILCSSRLAYRKGQDVVIKSFKRIIDMGHDSILIIAGDGSERANLEELVEKLDLTNKVIFTGNISRYALLNLYQICDLFVMISSLNETFGIVYIEAMACRKPVIGSDIAAVPEVIKDGKTGLLVNPYSVDECTESLNKILTNTNFADTLAKNAYKKVIKEFSVEIMARNTISGLFENMV